MKRSLTLALALVGLAALSGLGVVQPKADSLPGSILAPAQKPRPPSSTDKSRRATPCTTPQPTIVGWWPFEEMVGPTAGDIATGSDYGPYPYGTQSNDGTYGTGAFSPTPTQFGKVAWALSFDGNDFLTVPSHYEVDLSNRPRQPLAPYKFCSGFTIDAWIKTTQNTGVVVILDKRVTPATPVGYSLFLSDGRLGFQLADGTPTGSACGSPSTNPCTNYIASSPNVANGAWHLIAVTVQVHGSGTACPEVGKLYVDVNNVMTPVLTFVPRTHSLSSGNLPGTDIANSANLYIGQRMPIFGAGGYFNGLIDELEFYNHANHNAPQSDGALTQAQLQAIYNAGSAGKCK